MVRPAGFEPTTCRLEGGVKLINNNANSNNLTVCSANAPIGFIGFSKIVGISKKAIWFLILTLNFTVWAAIIVAIRYSTTHKLRVWLSIC